MPTPHGSRGGMAFSADELRVLRRALAHLLNPTTPVSQALPGRARAACAEDVQEVLRLAESIDDAVHEGGRMRAFALADLARYRAALPGTASGYLERLEEAVADGYLPDREDLVALRNLSALPCAPQERVRRLALRGRCGTLAQGSGAHLLEPSAPQLALAATASVAGNIADTGGDGGTDTGNVADFARPTRSLRQREKSRTALPATGVHPHPLPTRRGGAIPMAAFDTTAKPDSARSDAAGRGSAPAPGGSPVAPVRAIPTPGDLWPRGVRPDEAATGADAEEEAELATGTG
ncbi:hypothetical protein [Streptacidiphilus sp. P02-A3a]|uniref:hypothetical protein n=1 Tax=Streptacidiphilus sp. P02-A3a TaxID=2704468 RepID=UPI0015FD9437|nr:hypothetical protein GXP74_36890 [Streptacidiphilus sp. P02-A3a]